MDRPEDILQHRLELVLRQVSDQYAGEPVDVVEEALQSMIAEQFNPRQEPKPARVRRFAEQISALEPQVGECPTCHRQVPLWVSQPVMRHHSRDEAIICPGSGQAPA